MNIKFIYTLSGDYLSVNLDKLSNKPISEIQTPIQMNQRSCKAKFIDKTSSSRVHKVDGKYYEGKPDYVDEDCSCRE
jgi:hypothetical protein